MKRHWVVVALAVLLAGGACASRTGEGAIAHEMLRRAGSREPTPPRDGSEAFSVDTLSAPPDRVLLALRGAYATLGIPVTYYEPTHRRLGGFVRDLHALEGGPPSVWLDCGRGVTAEEYADTYSVSAAIATRVEQVDTATATIGTVVRARARARDVASDWLRCRSLGSLESRIAELVRNGPERD
jgi:hypothetical protein